MDPTARAAAWALKQACYAAWHTAPPQARAAADALRGLAAAGADPELQDLAAWTEGIAALSEGRLPEALASLQAAAAGFAARGDLQHAAEAQVPQLAALAMLGRDAEALACAEQALAQFLASGDQRSAGKVVHNLGSMLTRLDRHAEAGERFRQAAVHFARCGDAELSIAADLALANTLTWQFRFDDALLIFERGRARAERRGLAILQAHAREGIGRIELNRGRWHRALQALAESGRLLAEAGAPPQRRLEADAALADAYLALDLLDEAVALYDRLVAEAEGLDLPTDRAWALLQRARAQGRLGRADAALEGLAQADTLYRALDNRPSQGLVALARARLELGQGRPEALARAREAVESLTAAGIPGWRLEAQVAEADALAAGGDAAGARGRYESLLEEGSALPPVAQACRTGLGALALGAGDRAAARVHLEQALDAIDRERAALPHDEFRRGLGASAEVAHAHLVRLALAGGDSAQLLADLERGRARALTLGLGGEPAPDPGGSTRLRWLREQWRQAAASGDTDRLGGLGRQVQALEHELLEAWRREQAQRPADAARPAVALDALPAALGAGRALVAWHLQDGELIACVVTAEGVRHRCSPAGDLVEQLHGLRFQMDALRHGAPALQRHHGQLLARVRGRLQQLHARVWAPVQPLLAGCTEVVVVPHRELHYLPFAALHDGQRWLVESHRLSLAPSAGVWLALQQRPAPRRERALVVGVAAPGLPQVAHETAAVAAAFGAGAQVLEGAAATQAALLRQAGDVDVLHLACHAQFRADNPAFSSLQLADGPLTLHDLRGLRLRAGLVVLSACETGLSRLAPGDELQGLVRTFLLAGAGSVLATLWPVDDAASAALAAHFYAALRGGERPAAALQRAQQALAADGAHPWLWGAFALHGLGA